MSKLEELYIKKIRLSALIAQAITNGEKADKINRLEAKLDDIERQIDMENIRLYS